MIWYPFVALTKPDQSQLPSYAIKPSQYKVLLRQGFTEADIRRAMIRDPYASIDRIRRKLLGLQGTEMRDLLEATKTIPRLRQRVEQYKEEKGHSRVDLREFRAWLMMKEVARDHPYLNRKQLNEIGQLFDKHPDSKIDLRDLRHIDDSYQLRRRVRMLLRPKHTTIAEKEIEKQVKYVLDPDQKMMKLIKKWNKESDEILELIKDKIINKSNYKSIIQNSLKQLRQGDAPPTLHMILESIRYLEKMGLTEEDNIRRCLTDILSMIIRQHAKSGFISSQKKRQFEQQGQEPRIRQIQNIMTPAQIQDNVIREARQIIDRHATN